MTYVFDASFAGTLLIPDENDPHVREMYNKIQNEDEKIVPQLFWYEISNVFKNLHRRKRYNIDEIMDFFPYLIAIRLKSDNESGPEYSKKLLGLSNEYDLNSYDAAYLELAGRKNAILCTLDFNLIEAAQKRGVEVLN